VRYRAVDDSIPFIPGDFLVDASSCIIDVPRAYGLPS